MVNLTSYDELIEKVITIRAGVWNVREQLTVSSKKADRERITAELALLDETLRDLIRDLGGDVTRLTP